MSLAQSRALLCREAFHNAEHPANKHVAALLQVRSAAAALLQTASWPVLALLRCPPAAGVHTHL